MRRLSVVRAAGKEAVRIFSAIEAPANASGVIRAQELSALDAASYDPFPMLFAELGRWGARWFLCGNLANLLL